MDSGLGGADNRPMFKRKALVGSILIPLIVGLAGVVRVTDRSAIRPVDVVQLTGSGACFGVVLMSLVLIFKRPRE
jgi:hypothetical protein